MSSSFFEKLKKGMGIEIEEKEEEIKEISKVSKSKKPKTLKVKTTAIEEKVEMKEEKEKAPQEIQKLEIKNETWFETEGELAIDVYQTENDLVIQSAIAGVKPENLDLTLEGDRLAIRGIREKPSVEQGDYFTQECYWGPFSREVILPVEVDPNRVEAELKDGILTIRLPKILREKIRKIKVKT
jgi:HSP20 family protein